MFKDFTQQIISQGKINDIYLENFPNSLFIEKNSQYKLVLESPYFIMQIQTEQDNYDFILGIYNDSQNLFIDYGDGIQQYFVRLQYIFSQQAALYKIGDAYFEDNTLNVYTGTGFIKANIQNAQNLRKNYFDNYMLLLIKKDNKILFSYLINRYSKLNRIQHKYQKSGTYNICIGGGFTGFSDHNKASRDRIKKILSWGSQLNWKTMKNAFSDAVNLSEIPDQKMPNVNDCSGMLSGCSNLTKLPDIYDLFPTALINSTDMFTGTGITEVSNKKTPKYNSVHNNMFPDGCSIPSGFFRDQS